ncbi:hypothetical protein BDZ89DRAFT_1059016 [Hymenopellis radicata]|nr:hypothetical protein BDZ89DRAFT_1059016 [Hymenopellis radicata]
MRHEAGQQLSFEAMSAAVIGQTTISIPLGIVIGLLASFVQSLGLTIQRKSHVLNQRLPDHAQKAETRRPLWLLGFAIFISSNILGSFVQIASLPVVILAPLGAVSLLWNAFFARLLLGDVFSPWMILGTLLIAGGAVLIAVFGIVTEPTRSLEDLLELFRRPAFIAYFSVLGAFVVVSLVITHIAEYSMHRRIKTSNSLPASPPQSPSFHANDPSILITGVTDLTETITTERTPLLDRKANNESTPSSVLRALNRTRLIIAISYASFSGILSGMCLLFAKSGTELLLLTLAGDNQFWRWQAWMLLLALVVFALLQLGAAFCFYNLSSILNGLVYFDQFALIPPLHLGLVSLGIVILLGGVWVVSIQSGEGDADSWSEESDEEMLEDLHTTSQLADSPTSETHELDSLGLDLSLEHPLPPPSTISVTEGPRSPTFTVSSRRKRSAIDEQLSSSMRRHHQRAPSHSHIELSPPLPARNTVTTLAGAGFQIGLAATMSTLLGRPVGNGESGDDAVPGFMAARRRTVSEGDVRRNTNDRQDPDGMEDSVDVPTSAGKGKGKGRGRWEWLRRTFMRST